METPEFHADTFDAPGYAALAAEAAGILNPRGKFWRIESPTGSISHLYGTMHSSDPSVLDVPPSVLDTLRASRVFSPEIDFVAPSRRHLDAGMRRMEMFRHLRSDFDFDEVDLPPEIINFIRTRTASLGWGREAPDRLTFAALAEMLLSDPCEDFWTGTIPSLDSNLQTEAHIARVEVKGLESPSAFLTEMSKATRAEDAFAIVAAYAAYLAPTSDNRTRSTIIALYLQGKLALLSLSDRAYLQRVYGLERGKKIFDAVEGYLVAKRNANFLDAAAEDLKQGGLFMAVGAAHLPGETGLVARLRGAGYTVTRLPLPGETPE
ncbi:TraB/GumN family protein [Pseudaestuariivita sp.]|uniref:TraB/GumN family protein n=1 Tax=Pseudaestuariivita sp. TaxID=2211669 RepID=UPI00405973E6